MSLHLLCWIAWFVNGFFWKRCYYQYHKPSWYDLCFVYGLQSPLGFVCGNSLPIVQLLSTENRIYGKFQNSCMYRRWRVSFSSEIICYVLWKTFTNTITPKSVTISPYFSIELDLQIHHVQLNLLDFECPFKMAYFTIGMEPCPFNLITHQFYIRPSAWLLMPGSAVTEYRSCYCVYRVIVLPELWSTKQRSIWYMVLLIDGQSYPNHRPVNGSRLYSEPWA